VELGHVDLNVIAASVIAAMAPWAIAQGRTLALIGTDGPAQGTGNAHAIADALRNLIENAVVAAPVGTEVTVAVDGAGRIEVRDCGRGVAVENRDNVFKRFWRGPGEKREGAGLGLAIVSEIMRAHRGCVSVGDNAGGGAVFTLSFAPLPSSDTEPADNCTRV